MRSSLRVLLGAVLALALGCRQEAAPDRATADATAAAVVPETATRGEAGGSATAEAAAANPGGAVAGPGDLVATVTRVGDGDSLEVQLGDGSTRTVRLHGVDAPEHGQPWGDQARDHLRRLALRQRVTLRVVEDDPYGRSVAVAVGPQGDLGWMLVRGGHAWHYKRYAHEQDADTRARYAAAERQARRERLGLWSAEAPLAPWDFKEARREGREPGEGAAAAAADGSTAVIGNRRSRLYHLPGCPGYDGVSPANAIRFASEDAALDAGYRRAGNC